MPSFKRTSLILMISCAGAALSACDGANSIASPGTGGDVVINYPAPTPTPTAPTPTPTVVTAAAGCPSVPAGANGFTDAGVVEVTPNIHWRVCQLPSLVNQSITLTKIPGLLYSLNNRVDVGCDGGFAAPTAAIVSNTPGCGTISKDTNVTLSIEPGVVVFGNTGTSWLAVNRGNKINAVGTDTQPIIFTSRDNVLNLNNDQSIGQWGGVVLLGRGIITDCNYGSTTLNTCERDTEGAPVNTAVFGGRDNAYNAGTMKYVQIRYSGYILSADKELQSLTAEGVGTGTTLDYFQSHNSSDDGAEFFGGAVDFKHYIATGADDDSLDIDTGLQGNFQYVLVAQRPGKGDAFIEADSNGNEGNLPRQKTVVSNFTMIQPSVSSNNDGNDLASILIRGNSDVSLYNGVIVSPNNECLRLNGSGTTPATLTARSVVMTCATTKYLGTGSYSEAQVAAMFATGTNNNNDNFASTLTNLFVNGPSENGVTVTTAGLGAFFTTPTFIGAANDTSTWYRGWTCNAGYISFDNASNSERACTSIPLS